MEKEAAHHLASTSDYPINLQIESAEGSFLIDRTGKKYLDMISGVGVSALGHGDPRIKKAIHDQVEKHLHVMVYGEFLQQPQQKLSSELVKLLPSNLDTCYFVNSGTEANEGALKLAKKFTGRTKIVSLKGAYHGSTHGSLSVSDHEDRKAAFRPLLPEVYFIRQNQLEDLETIGKQTACVIAETIQGDAGVRIPDKKWLQSLRERCNEMGALLILDEIQCGMGRTGEWWAFEHYGITPDILTLGKALGAGMPIGAFISSAQIMSQLKSNPPLGHITTFGGHPAVCAASLAGLKAMKEDNLLSLSASKSKLIVDGLKDHKSVVEIRQIGLFFAVELKNKTSVETVISECLENGVILFYFLSCRNAFRMAPPLNISDDEIKLACATINKALDKLPSE